MRLAPELLSAGVGETGCVSGYVRDPMGMKNYRLEGRLTATNFSRRREPMGILSCRGGHDDVHGIVEG